MLQSLQDMHISEESRQMILGGNAKRLLGFRAHPPQSHGEERIFTAERRRRT
jgi:hypothetical protein